MPGSPGRVEGDPALQDMMDMQDIFWSLLLGRSGWGVYA
jgi:hypothetical protein